MSITYRRTYKVTIKNEEKVESFCNSKDLSIFDLVDAVTRCCDIGDHGVSMYLTRYEERGQWKYSWIDNASESDVFEILYGPVHAECIEYDSQID